MFTMIHGQPREMVKNKKGQLPHVYSKLMKRSKEQKHTVRKKHKDAFLNKIKSNPSPSPQFSKAFL